jgi:hypothetical protein
MPRRRDLVNASWPQRGQARLEGDRKFMTMPVGAFSLRMSGRYVEALGVAFSTCANQNQFDFDCLQGAP